MTQPPETPWTPSAPAGRDGREDPLAAYRRHPAPAGSAEHTTSSDTAAAPDSAGGRPLPPSARAPRRRRRWPWIVGLVAVLLVAAAVLAGWYAVSLGRVYDEQRQTVDAGVLDDAGRGPVNILVLGSDSREGEGETDIGERSDTMMVVHIPEDRKGVYVMSILRDAWVSIPGSGEAKVNAAFERGGFPLAIDTVEELLGVPVHHLMEVDFQGFRGLTEALGGVQVCNPDAFSSGQVNPSYYPRGRILLQDTAALRFVRERHAFQDGDVTRVKNQQRFVAGALDRFLSPEVLANPARTTEVVSTFSRHLTVDDGLTSGIVGSLAWQLRDVDGSEVEMFTIPRQGFGTSPTGESIVELDPQRMEELRAAFAADDLGTYVAARDREAEERRRARQAEASTDAAGVTPLPVLALLGQGTPADTPASDSSEGPTPAVEEDVCGS